jgi:hypothetical protein
VSNVKSNLYAKHKSDDNNNNFADPQSDWCLFSFIFVSPGRGEHLRREKGVTQYVVGRHLPSKISEWYV